MIRTVMFLIAAFCGVATFAAPKATSESRARELFEWFDTLGFEKMSDSKYVRVWLEGQASDGFLLRDDGVTFRVLFTDLTVSTITKAGAGESDPAFLGYREISLEVEARKVLQALHDPKYFTHWEEDHFAAYYDRLPRHAQVFVMARACAQRGLKVLGVALVDALVRHRVGDGANRWREFPDWLKDDFASALSWRALISFRDPSMSWNDLATVQRQISDWFPDSSAAEYAQSKISLIEALIVDEVEHARMVPASIEGLSVAEQAREWVWRLRDEQDPQADVEDMWPRPWAEPKRNSNGAIDALRKLGRDAVPALLAELRAPERPSRSIWRSTRYGGGVRIDVTQELATRVLNDIAGVNFYQLTSWERTEDRWPKVSAAVEEWLKGTQERGEKAWLVEAVRGGGRRASTCMGCLESRYADAFPTAALAGLAASLNSNDTYPRNELLRRLADHREPAVESVLVSLLQTAAKLGDRIALARLLREWGRPEADEAIRADWGRIVARGPNLESFDSFAATLGTSQEGDIEALRFLAGSERVDCLQDVLTAWSQLTAGVRKILVDLISDEDVELRVGWGRAAGPNGRVFAKRLLLLALEDVTEFAGMTMGFADGTIACPRLCDIAASHLNRIDSRKFAFDRFAPQAVRDRQRIEILNADRREDGVPELPLPPVRAKVAPEKENLISAVEWEEGSARPGDAMESQFGAWKGRAFSQSSAMAAISAYVRKPQPGTKGFRMTVSRDGDSTGIVVKLRLAPGESRERSGSTELLVTSGKKCLYLGSAPPDAKSGSWDMFWRRGIEAFKTPPQIPFVIRVDVAFSN